MIFDKEIPLEHFQANVFFYISGSNNCRKLKKKKMILKVKIGNIENKLESISQLPPCHYHTNALNHPLILCIFASQEEEPNDSDCQLKE